MAVYLGDSGYIELEREGLNTSLSSILDPGDVNVAQRRFSFDFDSGALITGDEIDIATTDGSTLELVDGHVFPDGRWFCHIDQAGGIRLYNNFADSINGERDQALPLVLPTRDIPIVVRTRNNEYRCIAQVSSYQMTTSRDSVDITSLGDEFRAGYANGLISGQGSLSCFWDYTASVCEGRDPDSVEMPHYLAQLVLRTQQGCGFLGRFFLKGEGRTAINRTNQSSTDDTLWWDARCLVTNVATNFSADDIVTSTVEFVTTGPVRLKLGRLPSYLLQENSDSVLLESGAKLELEYD
jgi:hypothetical protein